MVTEERLMLKRENLSVKEMIMISTLQKYKHTIKKLRPPMEKTLKSCSDSLALQLNGIRLRVRGEYFHHDRILNQNVRSLKEDPLEKQFDLFSQSNTVLKSIDLGSIICDIKFSELSYLDAFWTDYMNGSLLEALKGVFITDSLKEVVGQKNIQLLVNVDEDDYEEGRRLLLENCAQRSD